LRKLLLFCSTLALVVFEAQTSQLAFIVLNSQDWGSGSLPSGWQIKLTHGRPEISALREAGISVLRLHSNRASFGVERSLDVDPSAMPFLTWQWKVTELPAGADFRRASTDDQAAQVLIVFADRRVLSYIWDSSAPPGAAQNASSIPLVHIFAFVCRSGPAEMNRWLTETRNVAEDYHRAYGRSAPHVKGLRLQINSQHTGTEAESYFGQVAFRNSRL